MKRVRTLITQMVLEIMGEKMDKQDQKGIKKYGIPLDQVPFEDYDWNEMAIEEMADGLHYLAMENARLRRDILHLQQTIDLEVEERLKKAINHMYGKLGGGMIQ